MIKDLANELSLGLCYVQRHTHNSVPNLVNLKTNVSDKSLQMILHTEDTEDSIAMLKSMKKCGLPIVDEMNRDIKESLALLSTKRPKGGLISIFKMGSTS
ncbi:hypothetical protein NMG60_11018671 [Bertholletia excelsa]